MAKKPKLPHLVKKVLRKRAPVRIAPAPEPPPPPAPAPIKLPEPPAPAPLVMPYVPPTSSWDKVIAARDAKAHKRNWIVGAVVASGIFVLAAGYLAYLNTPAPEPAPIPVVVATATPTPTDAPTPEPTPTDTGTPLPTPTAVATPSPHHHRHHHYTALLICTGGTPSGPDQCTGK